MLDYTKDYGTQGIKSGDPDYPYGKALDANPATGTRGFPLKADFGNDILGAFQAILKAAKINPSRQVENATTSDLLAAIRKVVVTSSSQENEVLTVDKDGHIKGGGKTIREIQKISSSKENEVLTVDRRGHIKGSGKTIREIQIEAIAIGTRVLRLPGDSTPSARYGGIWQRVNLSSDHYFCIGNGKTHYSSQYESLPNISGEIPKDNGTMDTWGAFGTTSSGYYADKYQFALDKRWDSEDYSFTFRASSSDSTYGRRGYVHPRHYYVEVWVKTSHGASPASVSRTKRSLDGGPGLYHKVEEGLIKDVFSSDCAVPGCFKVCDGHEGSEGDHVEMFDQDGKRLPTPKIVEKGLIRLEPDQYLLDPETTLEDHDVVEELVDNWRIVRKPREQRVLEGLEEPASDEKIADGRLVKKTPQEKLSCGLISEEECQEEIHREEIFEARKILKQTKEAHQLAQELNEPMPSEVQEKRKQAWETLKKFNALTC